MMFTPARPILFVLLTIFSLLSFVSALPIVSPVTRDVWTPPITSPTSNTVWTAGCNYTVTWDASSPPSEITNPDGKVYLRQGNATQANPIAQNFNLSAGQVEITVPKDTQPGDDWIVVLFGDSGNWSPTFTIVAPSS
ncbi:hypothetical protein HYDPIDRAFT_165622 [Hydnomerulius pinastri MD-312]|nr:hypothetical protein HYDPIDRAFT_165622 [Hydnomerulius pinastri MD-312]